MPNVFNEGTSERTWNTCTQKNLTLTCKAAERVEGTTNPAMRESEVVSSEERMVMAGSQQIEGNADFTTGKLQKYSLLEFWNLVDTHNLDVIIGTESWLREEMNNAEVFRDDYTTFRRDRCTRGGGVFICLKNYIDCRELWADEDFEMIAIEVKSRDQKFAWEVVGIYRTPNDDV